MPNLRSAPPESSGYRVIHGFERALAPSAGPGLQIVKILIAMDLVLIAAYVVAGIFQLTGVIDDIPTLLHFDREASLQAWYGLLKWGVAASLLAAAFTRGRDGLFFAFTLVLLTALVFDAFEVHEQLGVAIAEQLAITPVASLSGRHLGEFLVLGVCCAIFLGIFALAFPMRRRENAPYHVTLTILIVALVGFAMILDLAGASQFLDRPANAMRIIASLSIVVEDGGELIVASLICGVVANAFFLAGKTAPALQHDGPQIQ